MLYATYWNNAKNKQGYCFMLNAEKCAKHWESMLKADKCWKISLNIEKVCKSVRKLFKLFKIMCQLFPALFDNFRCLKTTFFYLCFRFVCYAVQSLSRQYKTLSPFLGGEGVKAILKTALLLSKSVSQGEKITAGCRKTKKAAYCQRAASLTRLL